MYEFVYYDAHGAAIYRAWYDNIEMAILYAPDGCSGMLIHDGKTGEFVEKV
jgi:hypothetical protein